MKHSQEWYKAEYRRLDKALALAEESGNSYNFDYYYCEVEKLRREYSQLFGGRLA